MSRKRVALMMASQQGLPEALSSSPQGAGSFYLVRVPVTVENDHSVGRLEV